MTRLAIFSGLTLLVVCGQSTAQEKPPPLAGMPPLFASVTKVNKDAAEFTLSELQTNFEMQKIIVDTVVNGKIVKVPRTVVQIRVEKVTRVYSLKQTTVYDSAGKKIAIEDVWKRLTPGVNLVVSTDGRLPDANYLALLGKETMIVVSPQHVPPVPPDPIKI